MSTGCSPSAEQWLPIATRARDVYPGDLVLDQVGDPWRAESVERGAVGLRIRLVRGGRCVSRDIDPDDTLPVLHANPGDPEARPRLAVCATCGGRGKVRSGGTA